MYNPKTPFNTAAILHTPTYRKVNGIEAKTFTPGNNFFCSCKSYGGTESIKDGILIIDDTRQIETFFDPEITAGCCLSFPDETENILWEIITPPENIEMRNLWLSFKVRRLKGGA